MHDYEHVEHGFGPVWNSESRILILGTMPSPQSRKDSFYYMHPRNRFWSVLQALYAPQPGSDNTQSLSTASIEQRKQFLLEHHIAIWDVLQSCDIRGASDASIRNPVPNNLASILEHCHIQKIATNGTRATRLYARYCKPSLVSLGIDVPLLTLPSTSPAHAAMSLQQLIDEYRQILGDDGTVQSNYNTDCKKAANR